MEDANMNRETINLVNEEPLYRWVRTEIDKDDTVLDLGCGIGAPVKNLSCKFITGVDIYEGYKSIAEKYLDEVIVADITKINFNERSFDVVLILDVIEHLKYEDAVALIEKAEKWARKKVIVFTPIGFLTQELSKDGYDDWGFPNRAQRHICGFENDFFIQRGYSTFEYPGDKIHDRDYKSMCCVKLISLKEKKENNAMAKGIIEDFTLTKKDGKYYGFYTKGDKDLSSQSIYELESDYPDKNFKEIGKIVNKSCRIGSILKSDKYRLYFTTMDSASFYKFSVPRYTAFVESDDLLDWSKLKRVYLDKCNGLIGQLCCRYIDNKYVMFVSILQVSVSERRLIGHINVYESDDGINFRLVKERLIEPVQDTLYQSTLGNPTFIKEGNKYTILFEGRHNKCNMPLDIMWSIFKAEWDGNKIQIDDYPLVENAANPEIDLIDGKKYFYYNKFTEGVSNLIPSDFEELANRTKKEPIQLQEDLQILIDNMAYPPTQRYILDGLIPLGYLAERMNIIKKVAPTFFAKSDKFLDIGCSKGFFSLYGSNYFNEVVGIDTDQECIKLCNKIKNEKTTFECTSFRDFITTKKFDRIFIGNVHHYVYKDCGSWDWIYKLAAISTGQVLIEGPVGMECVDILKVIPEKIRNNFNYTTFLEVMDKFFVLKEISPSIRYTPDRYIMLFERKQDVTDIKYELNELPNRLTLRVSDGNNMQVYLTDKPKNNTVCKYYPQLLTGGSVITCGTAEPIESLLSRINVARMSPVSNGLLGLVYNKGKFVGWLEKMFKSPPLRYFEREKEAFKQYCKHVIFLTRNGYFDLDTGTLNFVEENKTLKIFDKGGTYPINILNETHYDLKKGVYFVMLRNSYHIISDDMQKEISKAFMTKDSHVIEKCFQKILDDLESENK